MSLLAAFDPAPGLSDGLFRGFMIVGAVGTILTAGYMLWMLQRVNFGEPSPEWEGLALRDIDRWETTAWVPLLASMVAIGVFPRIVFGATNDAVVDMVRSAFGG